MDIVKYYILNDICHYISLRTFQAGRNESDVEIVSKIFDCRIKQEVTLQHY